MKQNRKIIKSSKGTYASKMYEKLTGCKFLKNQPNISFVDKIILQLNKGIIFYFCK